MALTAVVHPPPRGQVVLSNAALRLWQMFWLEALECNLVSPFFSKYVSAVALTAASSAPSRWFKLYTCTVVQPILSALGCL